MSENAPANHLTIIIIYNGLERPITADSNETVQALLEQAMNAFGVHQNRHLMALWTEAGVELLPLTESLKQAGVIEGSRLLLRPSAVRGGATI